jgi:mono/diheme cytochrome c family protein
MRRTLKWLAIFFGGVIGLLVIAVAVMYVLAGARLNKSYDIQPVALTIPADMDAIGRGQYIFSINCSGCHGDNLAGTKFFDDPAIGYIPASNLTGGQGGIGNMYSDADFARAIRHGVDSDGKPLAIMPAQAFWHFSDEDLAAIIAYIKNAVPVDNELGEREIKPMGRVLFTAGVLDPFAAETIDHTAQRPNVPDRETTAIYGEYLVNTGDCRSCHGEALSGGKNPEPGAPPGPNLTAGSEVGTWTDEEFIATIRGGVTPNGRQLDSAYMPWEEYGRMTDDDLKAIYLYLQSQPMLETATE